MNVSQQDKSPLERRTKSAARSKRISRDAAEILNGMDSARLEIEVANQNFLYALDPLLVDMYIYQIKAAQIKYRYFLSKARELGIEQSQDIADGRMRA